MWLTGEGQCVRFSDVTIGKRDVQLKYNRPFETLNSTSATTITVRQISYLNMYHGKLL